jgi:hypothetical protein
MKYTEDCMKDALLCMASTAKSLEAVGTTVWGLVPL